MTHPPHRDHPQRNGFALLTVLWIVAAVATIGAIAAATDRDAFDAGRNRTFEEQAYWLARGCAELARSIIDDTLITTGKDASLSAHAWQTLGDVVASASPLADAPCDIRVEAVGTRLDVNEATSQQLQRLFVAIGLAAEVDALTDALLDWEDADDDPRPLGAEKDWYAAQQRPGPRNGPLQAQAELKLVRGFESLPVFDSVLTVEPGHVSLMTASAAVLITIPGFTEEAADRMIERRASIRPFTSLLDLMPLLSHAAADSLLANYPEATRATTIDPDAWILTTTSHVGSPQIAAVVELRLIRGNGRAVVERQRSW